MQLFTCVDVWEPQASLDNVLDNRCSANDS